MTNNEITRTAITPEQDARLRELHAEGLRLSRELDGTMAAALDCLGELPGVADGEDFLVDLVCNAADFPVDHLYEIYAIDVLPESTGQRRTGGVA